jgi:phosphate transport system protein
MTDDVRKFEDGLGTIRQELVVQAWRVLSICEEAFDAFFDGDISAAVEVVKRDDEVDTVDVEIEKHAVELLVDAARVASEVPVSQIREVLVIVKVNNELERIADLAVDIAERVEARVGIDVPETFRVVANSVLGILRDTCSALEKKDADIAKLILRSEDTVREFKNSLLREAENNIASGSMSVDCGFMLHEIANRCETISDHATNVAEQILYAVTGTIVRHLSSGWVEIPTQD